MKSPATVGRRRDEGKGRICPSWCALGVLVIVRDLVSKSKRRPVVSSSSPVIAASDLGVRFGDHAVLDGVTFEADTGDFVAIVGPNGGGKTTLIRVLLGLLEPDTGSAHVLGQRPTAVDSGLVGYVPQVKGLDRSFPARALDLVLTGIDQRWPFRVRPEERERALDALRRVGAEEIGRASCRERV